MTAPSCARPLTDEIVDAFAAYWLLHPYSWGAFHVCLEDGNWEVGAVDPTTDEERSLAAIFDELTPSQRRRLLVRVDQLQLGIDPWNRAPSLEERRRVVDAARGRPVAVAVDTGTPVRIVVIGDPDVEGAAEREIAPGEGTWSDLVIPPKERQH